MDDPAIFLVDNGSLRPEATFALRELAREVSVKTDYTVEPVSLLHSHKIPAEDLNGEPATIVKRRMRELLKDGQNRFIILPLFLGPSLAITDYLPRVVDELREAHQELMVQIAAPISGDEVEHPDPRLAEILVDHIQPHLNQGTETKVALVDHGTPIKPVNTLRNAVAEQLSGLLGRTVQPCSMERREGPDYDFNDPLLENLGEVETYEGAHLVLGLFFLLPGRHAGEGGDVAEISRGLLSRGTFQSIHRTPLLSEHPLLLEILKDRLESILQSELKYPS